MVTSERETAHQTLGKRTFWFAHSAFQEVKHINHILFIHILYIHILFIYIILRFPLCSFSLMFYGINFLWPDSGSFLYLVSNRYSAERIEQDNSVSFRHAILAHHFRNLRRVG